MALHMGPLEKAGDPYGLTHELRLLARQGRGLVVFCERKLDEAAIFLLPRGDC